MAHEQFPHSDFFGDQSRYHDVPLFGADLSFDWMNTPVSVAGDSCCYHDVATCPDCNAGMVRLGGCFSCPSCGWGSCN